MQWRAVRSALSRTRVSLGVDVGASHVRIVTLILRRGKRALQDGWSAALPLSAKANPEERWTFLRGALQEYLTRVNVPFMAGVSLAISGPEVTVFTSLVPRGTEAEIRQAVREDLSRRLSAPIEETAWTFFLPSEKTELEAGQVAVSVMAAPAAWIQRWISLCRSLRLVPTLVTTSSCTVHRLFSEEKLLAETPTVAVLEIAATASTVTFTYKGELEFVRPLPIGVDHLVRGLMRTVTTAEGEHTITVSESEKILQTCGIAMEEKLLPVAGLTSSQIYALLRPTLEYLYLEIQRTLYYYRQAFHRPVVERLMVTGEGALIPHLVEFLNANMDEATVETLEPLAQLKGWEPPSASVRETFAASGSAYSAAIGVAYPSSGRTPVRIPSFHWYNYRLEWIQLVARWTASLILGLLLISTLGLHFQLVRYRSMVQQTKTRLAQLESKVHHIQEAKRLKAVLAQQETLIQQAVSRQPLWAGVAKELSRISPEGIRLSSLETVEASFPLRIRLQGEILSAYTSVEVLYAQFQLALEGSAFFSDIQLVGMKKDLYSPVARATFELTCRLVY